MPESSTGPREYDPHAGERLPDEPPHDYESGPAPGRWVGPERREASAERRSGAKRRSSAERRTGLQQPAQPPLGGPERRSSAERRSGVDRRSRQDRRGWRGAGGLAGAGLEPNRYGFLSKAQELYPQVYGPVDVRFWQSLSDEERQELMRRQAAAQERVGFERGTEKLFIDGVEPAAPAGPGESGQAAELLTEADTDYALKRRHFQRRKQELEEIRQGKRKRINQYTQTRDEANCPVLGLPSVVEGIKATPALSWILPDIELPGGAAQGGGAVNSGMAFPEGMGDMHVAGAKKHPTIQPGAPPEVEGGTFYAPPEPGSAGAPPAERRQSTAPYSGPERRGEGERRRPEPDYGRPQTPQKHKLSGKAAQIESSNVYGLASRSELDYPSAYAPVSREMWAEMSEEQRAQTLRLQAIAQEKVGFEKHAPKYFIEDFDPDNPNAPPPGIAARARQAPVSELSLAAPRLILGGILIGAGAMQLSLALTHVLSGAPSFVYGIAAAAVIGGVLLTLNPQG